MLTHWYSMCIVALKAKRPRQKVLAPDPLTLTMGSAWNRTLITESSSPRRLHRTPSSGSIRTQHCHHTAPATSEERYRGKPESELPNVPLGSFPAFLRLRTTLTDLRHVIPTLPPTVVNTLPVVANLPPNVTELRTILAASPSIIVHLPPSLLRLPPITAELLPVRR